MPLDLFITPFTDQTRRPSPYEPLNQLGRDMSERAYQRRQLDERARQFDASHANDVERTKGLNEYYKDQIAARREATAHTAQVKTEDRVNKLLDMLRKSAHENRWDEVESIRQELTRLGYSADESDTAFKPPEPQAQLEQSASQGAAKPPAPKGPKPNPGFRSALDTFMRTENEGSSASTIEAGDPLASPSPFDALGAPAPKPKGPGGRFTIKDRQGNIVQTLDVPQEKENRRQAIESALSGYIDDPMNPESKAAMQRASTFAQRLIDTGTPADRAVKEARDQYNKEMSRYKPQRLPSAAGTGGGGGSLGVGKQEQSRLGGVDDNVRDIIFKIEDKNKLPAARDAMGAMSNMDRALDKAGDEGFAGGAAISSYLKAISGAQVSDTEANRIFGGAGMEAKWQTDLNRYIDGGKLDPALIQGLRGVASRARDVFRARAAEAARQAENLIEGVNSLATPEERKRQKDVARNHFMGFGGSGGGGEKKPKSLEDKLRENGL